MTRASESALVLDQGGSPLVGVVTEPDAVSADRPAVIVLNSGIVHRVGPGRQSVRLARRLAEAGFLVVRFDHGGVGDSGVRRDRATWLDGTILDVRAVMDELARTHGCERFVLAGLCSGAVTSFKTALEDPRVVGVASLNSQGLDRSDAWNTYVRNRGWVRHYLESSLRNPDSWKRAFTGRVQYRRMARVFARAVKQRLFPPKHVVAINNQLFSELAELVDNGIRLLFVFAEGDHAQDYFDVIARGRLGPLRESGHFRAETVPRSDHTFTLLANQGDVLRITLGWMRAWAPDPAGRPPDALGVTGAVRSSGSTGTGGAR